MTPTTPICTICKRKHCTPQVSRRQVIVAGKLPDSLPSPGQNLVQWLFHMWQESMMSLKWATRAKQVTNDVKRRQLSQLSPKSPKSYKYDHG